MLLADADQIRRADQIMIEQFQFPGIMLMETAGRLATDSILTLYPDQLHFLILAGPGNNGGDGLAIARRLHLAGKKVEIILSHSGERFRGDAGINYQIVRQLPIPIKKWQANEAAAALKNQPLLIDALLGTGIVSELRGSISEMIQFFRQQTLTCIAIDLPSGLNASSGFVLNEVIPAAHTLTFQLPKICHYVTPAANLCGALHTLDIEIWPQVVERLGIKRRVLDAHFVERLSQKRPSDSHKGTFGHVLLLGGSRNMAGAICLSAEASMRAGAGLCTVACPEACREVLLTRLPEAMCVGLGSAERSALSLEDLPAIQKLMQGKTAVAIGPGMGTSEGSIALLKALLPLIDLPLIIDADGLNILSQFENWQELLPANCILTPHPGEMRRLSQRSDANQYRLELSEEMARSSNAGIVLKGKNSLIADPSGETFINPTGNAGMATAGSGDVLTGIIASLLAQGYPRFAAASMGTYLHGQAGDKAAQAKSQSALIASDIIQML
ncbi:MAG: NAD(P)H-hydrate dehydratase [Bacteroidota bacterium]